MTGLCLLLQTACHPGNSMWCHGRLLSPAARCAARCLLRHLASTSAVASGWTMQSLRCSSEYTLNSHNTQGAAGGAVGGCCGAHGGAAAGATAGADRAQRQPGARCSHFDCQVNGQVVSPVAVVMVSSLPFSGMVSVSTPACVSIELTEGVTWVFRRKRGSW